MILAFCGDSLEIICATAKPRTDQRQIVTAKSRRAELKKASVTLIKYPSIWDLSRFVVSGFYAVPCGQAIKFWDGE